MCPKSIANVDSMLVTVRSATISTAGTAVTQNSFDFLTSSTLPVNLLTIPPTSGMMYITNATITTKLDVKSVARVGLYTPDSIASLPNSVQPCSWSASIIASRPLATNSQMNDITNRVQAEFCGTPALFLFR